MYRISSVAIFGKFLVALVAIVVIQGILGLRFRVFEYFDLPLVFAVYYGFTLGKPIPCMLIGSGLGLMQDSLSGAAMGTNGFSKTLIAFLAASAVSKLNIDQPIARILALFLFSLGDGLVISILGLVVGPTPGLQYTGSVWGWFLTATFNTLLGLVMFGYHDRLGHATA
jgi:rod shape-determining protein MreD